MFELVFGSGCYGLCLSSCVERLLVESRLFF